MGGAAFLGPGDQGTPRAVANALAGAGGLAQFSLNTPAADIALPAALGPILGSSNITVPQVPRSEGWMGLVYCFFRIDATLADTVIVRLDVAGPGAEWDAVVGAASVTCGCLVVSKSLAVGSHGVILYGQSLVGGGNAVLKKLSGGGNPASGIGYLLLAAGLVP
jgi:hypothetical protein